MRNWFKSLINNRSFLSDPSDQKLNNSIDWQKSVIAGSYALKQFTGDQSSESHDVNIMIACKDKNEFEIEAKNFAEKSQAKLNQESHLDKESFPKNHIFFHDRVLGSKTYQLENYQKPIQLICLQQKQNENAVEILNEISDKALYVSYSVTSGGERIFHISEKGLEILWTKK